MVAWASWWPTTLEVGATTATVPEKQLLLHKLAGDDISCLFMSDLRSVGYGVSATSYILDARPLQKHAQ
jgi:hypothetical protein